MNEGLGRGEVKDERVSGGLGLGVEGVNGGVWGGEEWGSRGEGDNKGDGGQVGMGGCGVCNGGAAVGGKWKCQEVTGDWGSYKEGEEGGQDATGGAGRVALGEREDQTSTGELGGLQWGTELQWGCSAGGERESGHNGGAGGGSGCNGGVRMQWGEWKHHDVVGRIWDKGDQSNTGRGHNRAAIGARLGVNQVQGMRGGLTGGSGGTSDIGGVELRLNGAGQGWG